MMRNLACALIFSLAWCSPTYAFGVCEAKVLRDVSPPGRPDSAIKRGETIGSITSYTIDDQDPSIAEFCSKGGYCYPSKVLIGDKPLDAMKLTNCRIVKRGHDYSLEPIRDKIPNKDLRRYYLDEKLGAMGMCSACAGSAREEYINNPESPCAIQVREALEGFPDSIRALKKDDNACTRPVNEETMAAAVPVQLPVPVQTARSPLPVMSKEEMKNQPDTVRLMAMAIFVRMECPALELSDDRFSVLKNTLYPNDQAPSSADNQRVGQMVAYFTVNKEVACQAAWNSFGSSGSIVPGLISLR